MKKIFEGLLFLISFLLFAGEIYAGTGKQLVTELTVFDNDTTFQYRYFYDTHFHKVLETKYFQKDNNWIRLFQIEWLYADDNCTLQRENIWKDGNWKTSYAIDYEYVDGKVTNEIHKTYANDAPVLLKKTEYAYSQSLLSGKNEFLRVGNEWALVGNAAYKYSNGTKLDTATLNIYSNNELAKQYRLVYSYNIENKLTSELCQEKESGKSWMNSELTKWYYKPGTSNVLSQRTQKWIPELPAWENIRKTENQYNSEGKITSETYLEWKSMFWENQSRYDYIYDTGGLQTKKVFSLPIYNKWRELISINYLDFNSDKANHVESKFEFWGGNAGEFTTSFIPFAFNDETVIQKAKELTIKYADASEVTLMNPHIQDLNTQIKAYPNPSKGIFYLNTQGSGISAWTILTPEGKVLKTEIPHMQTGVIDLTDFPKGIYILKIKTQNSQYTQKLIKE